MAQIDNEKRELVLKSLQFLMSQRNKELFKLKFIRGNKRKIINEENKILRESRRIKNRIIVELESNINLFTDEEKNGLGLNDKSDE